MLLKRNKKIKTMPTPPSFNTGSRTSAFTLLELGIVLVIIGLLTGGILAGKNLMRAAELRAVSEEYNQWQIAYSNFQDQYQAHPGDIANAQSYWPGGITNNGNGDGRILGGSTANAFAEMFTFWQHLALSGLISGEYSGRAGPSAGSGYSPLGDKAQDAEVGENCPRSKLNNAGWTMKVTDWSNGSSNSRYMYNYGNVFAFGRAGASTGETPPAGGSLESTMYTIRGILTPTEAWNIDNKLDDGQPGTGIVIGYPFSSCADASASDEFDSNYQLNVTDPVCALYLRAH